jgi:integrase
LPRTRFHDLPHTCATLLLRRNVNPKIVQELLGYASTSDTMDTYSYILPDMQGEVVSAMESASS